MIFSHSIVSAISTVVLILATHHSGHPQQLHCKISVNYEAVSTTNKDLLRDFSSDVSDYLNNYPWGPDADITVNCGISIFVQSVVGENRYSAQAVVVSQREWLKTDKNTAVVRLKDDAWEFTYIPNRTLNHNPNSFNDLTSFLDFYAYIILGYDYDSYEALGGTTFFQKASNVASVGRSSGQRGWQITTGNFSRPQLIDDILNPNLSSVRKAVFTYHFAGIDSLYFDRAKAQKRMLEALELVGAARKNVDPRNLAMRAFFDAKYQEIAEVFENYPDPAIFKKLGQIDPAHVSTYEQYRDRRE